MPCFHAHVQLHKARSGWQGVETWIVLKIQLCCERFIVSTNQIHRLPHSFLLKGMERVHKDFFLLLPLYPIVLHLFSPFCIFLIF